jgi:hypothetical protein
VTPTDQPQVDEGLKLAQEYGEIARLWTLVSQDEFDDRQAYSRARMDRASRVPRHARTAGGRMSTEGYVLSDGRATGLPEDLVAEVAAVLEWYGCDQGRLTGDAAARAILAARAYDARRAAEERAHARRRDDALRLADLAQSIQRARLYVATRHS